MIEIIAVFIILMIIILVFASVLQPEPEIYKSDYKKSPINQTFYWINLDKSVDRREKTEKVFKKHKVKNVRVSAIDGGSNKQDRVDACALSHIKAIKTFYESGEEVGVICEDDLSFEHKKYWRNSLDGVIRDAPEDWEILQIGLIVGFFWPLAIVTKTTKLYIPYHDYFSSTIGYVINRKGAEKLLKFKNQMTIAEHYIYKPVKTYTYKYPMITVQSNNVSSINHLMDESYSKDMLTKYLKYK